MLQTVSRLGDSVAAMSLLIFLTTACVVARLPAESSVKKRWPGQTKLCIFE